MARMKLTFEANSDKAVWLPFGLLEPWWPGNQSDPNPNPEVTTEEPKTVTIKKAWDYVGRERPGQPPAAQIQTGIDSSHERQSNCCSSKPLHLGMICYMTVANGTTLWEWSVIATGEWLA